MKKKYSTTHLLFHSGQVHAVSTKVAQPDEGATGQLHQPAQLTPAAALPTQQVQNVSIASQLKCYEKVLNMAPQCISRDFNILYQAYGSVYFIVS